MATRSARLDDVISSDAQDLNGGRNRSDTALLRATTSKARTDNALPHSVAMRALDETLAGLRANRAMVAGQLASLPLRAMESLRDSARATLDLAAALQRARDPSAAVIAHLELYQRSLKALNANMVEFLIYAHDMTETLVDPATQALGLLDGPGDVSRAGAAPDRTELGERLKLLTRRQKRVLELVVDGLPNKLIAHELGIGETTVKAHVGEILRKLGVYNRARAIALIARADLRAVSGDAVDDVAK